MGLYKHFWRTRPYVHRVKAMSRGSVFALPINLSTINHFFNKSFSPAEARVFLQAQADKSITHPANFEEQALGFIGKELYEAFFYGYTKKQWGCEPRELPASVLKRIPVRFNYDDNYHNNLYTGIPVEGYTAIMEKMIHHKRINIFHNRKLNPSQDLTAFDHVFYTGPLDAWFDYSLGRLGYRTVIFEKNYAQDDYQGLAQMNYCDENIPYTRITEHKHFAPWEQHEKTIYFKEYSVETGKDHIPYYPKRLEADKQLLLQYREKASELKNVSFLGRLATYRYMDMHHVIGEALDFADKFLHSELQGSKAPVFSNEEDVK